MEQRLTNIVERLKQVPGIAGIVLGGSRATGTHTAESDVDIGLYYDAAEPLDIAALSVVATELDDSGREELVTPIGGWGPWINGGGWLHIGGIAVDLLYRELDKVTAVAMDCQRGSLSVHYQPGHPHAFCSPIYMGEAAACRILWDPQGRIEQLKSLCSPYPDALQKAVADTFMWEAGFSIANAHKGVKRGDVSYVAGHLFRAVSCMAQVLFALNRTYMLNEKGAVAACARFPISPVDLANRIHRSYAQLSPERTVLASAVEEMDALVKDTERLKAELLR
ncbi:nucleotidyltransferase domain-containing protein [Paenibacillus lignilyticus]|uniref:Nucleotidyltransferase domain-containing protein n=1 Tax=Paenibacillus lignilyticus TaxID=1172615 RepID=A0ABS5C689_9BACL|nr:nucleotidyltransferase domain-containing protein [Paenibacillus lignilyticus]MBP3961506.1 nucleotidyltransferase domain-containing protein [Paenibacillus lignilyticus]